MCSGAREQLHSALMRLLPLLCNASSSSTAYAVSSLSAITLVMQHFLTPSDWLPCLQSNLDAPDLLQSAFQQLADSSQGTDHAPAVQKLKTKFPRNTCLPSEYVLALKC